LEHQLQLLLALLALAVQLAALLERKAGPQLLQEQFLILFLQRKVAAVALVVKAQPFLLEVVAVG